MMRTFLGALLAFSLLVGYQTTIPSLVQAQQPNFEGGINLQLGFPQGEFAENLDNPIGFGFGVDLLWMPMEFGVGASINYLIYGSESRREPFSMTIPDVQVEVNTTNSILLGHLLMRMQYPDGFVRPYADGLVGVSYLSTDTEIENLGAIDPDDEIASSTNFDDTAFSYGFGGGILFRVFEGKEVDEPEAVFVDFGVRYIYGGDARYLKEGSIVRSRGNVAYNYEESATDIITGHLGVVVKF